MRIVEDSDRPTVQRRDDVYIVGSKFNPVPTPFEYQYRYALGDDIQILPSDGKIFEKQLYFGIYSMPGSSIRIGYGLKKDPFGGNNALLGMGCKREVNQSALQKELEDQKNAQIESELFSENPVANSNPGRFRKNIQDRRRLLTNNASVRERYEVMCNKFVLRQKEERKQQKLERIMKKQAMIRSRQFWSTLQ